MTDKVLVKKRNGQFEWLTKTEAGKLIKAGEAKQCDPKTYRTLEKQPVEPVKKKSK